MTCFAKIFRYNCETTSTLYIFGSELDMCLTVASDDLRLSNINLEFYLVREKSNILIQTYSFGSKCPSIYCMTR